MEIVDWYKGVIIFYRRGSRLHEPLIFSVREDTHQGINVDDFLFGMAQSYPGTSKY